MTSRVHDAGDADHYVTQAQLDKSLEAFGKKFATHIIDEVSELFQSYAVLIDERFNKVEKRLDVIESKVDAMQKTLNKAVARVVDVEKVNDVQDARLVRLEHRLA